jgi:hypothetical protein
MHLTILMAKGKNADGLPEGSPPTQASNGHGQW